MEPSFGLVDSLRTVPRISRIVRILRRHGILAALYGERHWPEANQVRSALEDLGTVFLKFGQVLALRRDLLPPSYVKALEGLHDSVSPVDPAVMRAAVEEALGRPVGEAFASFDDEPLASATIAQVHAATLPDGQEVVVKIQRPALEQTIAADISALTYLATLAERVSLQLRPLDPVAMVREFHDSLRQEVDFRHEAANIRRFRAALSEVQNVWIPDVIDDLSVRTVLTMEHSPGMRVDLYVQEHPDEAGDLARGIAAIVLRQIFEDGVFHADPHPGNLFVLPDGRICLHDFGMVGVLPPPLREGLVQILDAVVRNDARAVTDAYLEIGLAGDDVNRGALENDLGVVIQNVHDRPLAEVSVGDALESMLRVGSRHRIRSPGAMLLLTRALFITEAVLRDLDPDLNVVEVFQAEVERIAARRHAPERLWERSRSLALELERIAQEAPGDLRRLLRRGADGNLGKIHVVELEAIGGRADRAVERLTGGVASGALLVAGSILIGSVGWPSFLGTGMLVLGVLGTGLVAVGALRSRFGN